MNVSVIIADQFIDWQAQVTVPRFFCNPVEKRVGDPGTGPVYAIRDPNQHYTCDEYVPEEPTAWFATMTDQFLQSQSTLLHPSRLLCVPTDKTGVTSTGTGTWGRIEVLYRQRRPPHSRPRD